MEAGWSPRLAIFSMSPRRAVLAALLPLCAHALHAPLSPPRPRAAGVATVSGGGLLRPPLPLLAATAQHARCRAAALQMAAAWRAPTWAQGAPRRATRWASVSYTHLTLPTIYSV